MIATQKSQFASRIIGTGSAFPSTRLTNDDLAKRVDTSNEWIIERTGIQERRISNLSHRDERNSSLGLAAAEKALKAAGKTAQDIDQILYATCTPDTLIPSTACWLQQKLGAKKAWAMDLNAACSGFIFALATADQFIKAGMVKTSLVIGGDILSAFTNWSDRSSCILFGDAAGAVVIEQVPSTSERKILSFQLTSDGTLWDLFHIPAGGSNLEVTPEIFESRQNKMQMKGKEMFKVAVRSLADLAVSALESQGLTLKDLDWVIPHQANLRIIEAVAKRLNISMDKFIVNIQRYGNTSSATVPTALDESVRDGRIQPGQLILFDVFGAGLTSGSALVRW